MHRLLGRQAVPPAGFCADRLAGLAAFSKCCCLETTAAWSLWLLGEGREHCTRIYHSKCKNATLSIFIFLNEHAPTPRNHLCACVPQSISSARRVSLFVSLCVCGGGYIWNTHTHQETRTDRYFPGNEQITVAFPTCTFHVEFSFNHRGRYFLSPLAFLICTFVTPHLWPEHLEGDTDALQRWVLEELLCISRLAP